MRVRKGKIAEYRGVANLFSLMQQALASEATVTAQSGVPRLA
jgi:hypothetical protein